MTLNGNGAWIGIPKLGSSAERLKPEASTSFKATVESFTGYDVMKVEFTYAGNYWLIYYARPMLAAMFANPIDLARLVMLSQFDVAALLGYTGALFHQFLGGTAGLLVAITAITLWATVPALLGARLFHRKDF
jgi:Cu-processing system permease protein